MSQEHINQIMVNHLVFHVQMAECVHITTQQRPPRVDLVIIVQLVCLFLAQTVHLELISVSKLSLNALIVRQESIVLMLQIQPQTCFVLLDGTARGEQVAPLLLLRICFQRMDRA